MLTNWWSLKALRRLGPLRWLVLLAIRIRYRHGRTYTIRRGPLKGMNWCYTRDQTFWMPFGQFEMETARRLAEKLRPGDVFIDIGANVGYFTLLAAKRVGRKGKVFAFEPEPRSARVLEAQMSVNGIGNTTLVETAVSDESGEAEFHVAIANPISHLADITINHHLSKPLRTIRVKTIRLDDYVDEHGIVPDVIKIDIEGAEMKALHGAERTLRKHLPAILVATHSARLKEDCAAFLQNVGYRVEELTGFEVIVIGIAPEHE